MGQSKLLSSRARAIDASGIRRVFELGAKLSDPINLSIGQPDFPVPDPIKDAAVGAILENRNGYTVTQGIGELRGKLTEHLARDVGWDDAGGAESETGLIVTSGTSGALLLAFLALTEAGDEVIMPDPYFVMYPHLATMTGAKAVMCDTYPDFRMTAERVEPLITERTKIVLANTPSNPCGVVLSQKECAELRELCRAKGVLLISDEIYDEFTYSDGLEASRVDGSMRCPSPAREAGAEEDVLLIRGFGKTYGITGWRLGYAAGPRWLIEEMAKFQQYTFVCAPSPLQYGAMAALEYDMQGHIDAYQVRRDKVVEALGAVAEVAHPKGAFYAFVKVPERLGVSATEFVERCIERSVLVIPGGVFSQRDTHIRLSYATDERSLERGLGVLVEMMGG